MYVFLAINLQQIDGCPDGMALEPMGHLAGTATSVFSALAKVVSVTLSVPIGLMYNGTPLPLMTGALCAVILAYLLMRRLAPEAEG